MLEFPFLLFLLSCNLNGTDGKFTGDREICNTIGQVNFTAEMLPDYTKVKTIYFLSSFWFNKLLKVLWKKGEVEIQWTYLVSPKEAAICFTSVAVYYNPSDKAPMLFSPEIVRISHYLQVFFKKKTTINIITKDDLEPLTLPVCGGERNKVIVFVLWLGNTRKKQRTVLKELDICHSYGTPDLVSKANTRCYCQPVVFAIMCSLTLMNKNLFT